jgi:hypothetical protein
MKAAVLMHYDNLSKTTKYMEWKIRNPKFHYHVHKSVTPVLPTWSLPFRFSS